MRRQDHNLLRKRAGQLDGSGAPDVDEGRRRSPHKPILCGGCRHPITDVSARIEISGRHEHTCVNPAGYVYRIGCFRRAPGCVGHGEPTDAHTWFAGYRWQISLCEKCHMHLGWAFAGEGDGFHGLIVDRVTFDD